jgi:hypothetical protein
MSLRYEPLAPTVAAIDEWLARTRRPHEAGEPIYGVNVRTKHGRWRCITSPACKRVGPDGTPHYETIRAEGKSSEGRDVLVDSRKIVEARGWVVG